MHRLLESCYDKESGGFAQTPGGKPDCGTTASGLMAIGALKIDAKPYTQPAIDFFAKNAKTFEEKRIAAAGLEAIGATSPDFAEVGRGAERESQPGRDVRRRA